MWIDCAALGCLYIKCSVSNKVKDFSSRINVVECNGSPDF